MFLLLFLVVLTQDHSATDNALGKTIKEYRTRVTAMVSATENLRAVIGDNRNKKFRDAFLKFKTADEDLYKAFRNLEHADTSWASPIQKREAQRLLLFARTKYSPHRVTVSAIKWQ